jgi:hypothetical protein
VFTSKEQLVLFFWRPMSIYTLKTLLLIVACSLFYLLPVEAVIVTKAIDIHLTVEDADMKQATITNLKFNGQDVDISKKNFMHRKVTQTFKVPPGQYEIEWTTEKTEKPWGGKAESKKHNRMIVLELSDVVVYVNVRGEFLTTY